MDKLGWAISVILAGLLLYFFIKNGHNGHEIRIDKLSIDGTHVAYSLELNKDNPILVGFTEEGNLKILRNFALDLKQDLVFHDNGFLAVKTTVDLLDRIQGRQYYFHESNGNMSHNYNYLDDRRVGVSTSHHPNTHYLREYMEYDSLGRMYYRITFDTLGNKISEEGN